MRRKKASNQLWLVVTALIWARCYLLAFEVLCLRRSACKCFGKLDPKRCLSWKMSDSNKKKGSLTSGSAMMMRIFAFRQGSEVGEQAFEDIFARFALWVHGNRHGGNRNLSSRPERLLTWGGGAFLWGMLGTHKKKNRISFIMDLISSSIVALISALTSADMLCGASDSSEYDLGDFWSTQ